ncbi:phosphotransferase KptA/Tpt1 [Desulfatibacillum aliphaticivorans]|uniref:Phosphotransferase KptA/Tpt1 n=1 Tax=Desulfatibacillum aliphaticivorans TaxID=218208 RepID=B8FBA0_DESAL|nr:RNA 2'-phosphotransferase [Desulfatibacillum aliphaticivorans]ACL04544.1 phosphotransferase KptA/Tpt1 [Desulfatibacillum aliphaticivorans]
MGSGKRPETLNKFLAYALGRRPDEFGLFPDEDGWVKVKDLVRALSEEDGWKHVNKAHIKEVAYTLEDPAIEYEHEEGIVRAVEWDPSLYYTGVPEDLPKLLYVGARNKTYPEIDKKGIFPVGAPFVILCRDEDMAFRIGKRRDGNPIVLTVNTAMAQELGVVFEQAGEVLLTAEFIPKGCFTGPPLPKVEEMLAAKKPAKPKPAEDPALSMGAFAMDLDDGYGKGYGKGKGGDKGFKKKGGRKKRSWKEDARRQRRQGRDDEE